MKNNLICKNCGTSNPLYALNCNACQSFLRARVPNIDFWDTVWDLFVAPVSTAIRIIQAEKKNYIFFLYFLLVVKTATVHFILQNYFSEAEDYSNSFSSSLLISGFSLVIYFSIIPLLLVGLLSFKKIKTRYKDNLTLLLYTFTPILIGFLFLTPFHFALYGEYWYTINPSPLLIKPIPTYILYVIEGLMGIWSAFLIIASVYSQTNLKMLSAILGFIFFCCYACIFFIAL